jgi:CRISPR-associated protein Csh1
MVGISKVKNNFSNRLFNKLRYYAVPENLANVDYDKALARLQSSLSKNYDKNKESMKVLTKIEAKNLKVNFLFWRPDQASFIVLDIINDVYYKDLQEKLQKINEVNYSLSYKKFALNYYFNFNDLYWLLFPNYKSHNSPDPKLYRKELLNLIDSIFKNREIDYNYLIKQFIFIFRKRYLKNKNNLSEMIKQPLKMNLLLKWLNEIANLKGGIKMVEGKSYIEIQDPDIKEIFITHEEVYIENNHRQGLFILGVLMNQILKEQKNKNINIMNKLSFDGLPVRRVKTFVKDITEMLNIYKIYRINQLRHAQMIDRLQGIENSQLTKDEVVFYILSGISFGRYLGHKYYNKKEEEKQNDRSKK